VRFDQAAGNRQAETGAAFALTPRPTRIAAEERLKYVRLVFLANALTVIADGHNDRLAHALGVNANPAARGRVPQRVVQQVVQDPPDFTRRYSYRVHIAINLTV